MRRSVIPHYHIVFFLTDKYQKHNVFMLYSDPEIQKAVGQTEPVEVVRALRALKDKS
jgi:hypothetical protein